MKWIKHIIDDYPSPTKPYLSSKYPMINSMLYMNMNENGHPVFKYMFYSDIFKIWATLSSSPSHAE